MPRYFFHVSDGAEFPDDVGDVLASPREAKARAIQASGELLRDRGMTFWTGTEWRMHVVDELGQTVCRLAFTAQDGAA
ncbi:MAG: hypothetical protein QOD74_999 [Variibacter sp.]|jgi:hypothetical protein|nr:hypothetical protein [Variibacter sp.]